MAFGIRCLCTDVTAYTRDWESTIVIYGKCWWKSYKKAQITTKLQEECWTNKLLSNYWLLFWGICMEIKSIESQPRVALQYSICISKLLNQYWLKKKLLTFYFRTVFGSFFWVCVTLWVVCSLFCFSFSICVSVSIGVVVDCRTNSETFFGNFLLNDYFGLLLNSSRHFSILLYSWLVICWQQSKWERRKNWTYFKSYVDVPMKKLKTRFFSTVIHNTFRNFIRFQCNYFSCRENEKKIARCMKFRNFARGSSVDMCWTLYVCWVRWRMGFVIFFFFLWPYMWWEWSKIQRTEQYALVIVWTNSNHFISNSETEFSQEH